MGFQLRLLAVAATLFLAGAWLQYSYYSSQQHDDLPSWLHPRKKLAAGWLQARPRSLDRRQPQAQARSDQDMLPTTTSAAAVLALDPPDVAADQQAHNTPAALQDRPLPGSTLPLNRQQQLADQQAGDLAAGQHQQAGGSQSWDALANAAVILFCYNRAGYLQRTLESLARLEGLEHVSVYVSQDGRHPRVATAVAAAGSSLLAPPRTRAFEHWQRPRVPQLGPTQPGRAWLSQHYAWGLARVFAPPRAHSHAIIVEDDMLFSPDFLHLFAAGAPLLAGDPSLWCVSSWNDNGLATLAWDPRRLFRTSYFPGLGWMMRRELWEEIGASWPLDSWDHWMRLNTTSHGRECVVPEVNRNRNIGERGANMDRKLFARYLAAMAWAQDPPRPWGPLDHLLLPNYQRHLRALLASAQLWEWRMRHARTIPAGQVFLLVYLVEEYSGLARQLKVWPFPRGHHRHLTRLPWRGSTLLLADARACPLLPPHLRVRPPPGLLPVPGRQAESCDSACVTAGLRCSRPNFAWLNACEALAAAFPCQAGCALELGDDIPAYVAQAGLPTSGQCLVSQQQATCGASHPATARLCPCLPAAADMAGEELAAGADAELGQQEAVDDDAFKV